MTRPNAMHLIVGGDSMLGRALSERLLASGASVAPPTRRAEEVGPMRLFLDLAKAAPNQRWAWPVDVAYVCAGITKLEMCRNDPVGTARINVAGGLGTVTSLIAQGAFVIYLSSNLVFDGSLPRRRAEDPVCPLTEYGRQKAEVERRLTALDARAAIVRFTKIISSETSLFRTWVREIQRGREVRPYADMVLAPIPMGFAVAVLERVAQTRTPGIVQVSADRDVTYEEIARHLSLRLGGAPEMIRPLFCKQDPGLLEPVPAHTCLDTARLRGELNMDPPEVGQTLDELLAEMKS